MKIVFGTEVAYTNFMFRWLALAYIVAVLVVSAKARAKNDLENASSLAIDHQTK